MYNTGLVHSARNPVFLTSKFTVNMATGAVTLLNGKRIGIAAGTTGSGTSLAGTGVITMTLPQIFTAIEMLDPTVLDPTMTGANLILTQGETTVGNKTTLQFTLAKGSTPAAVTTGTFTMYIGLIGVTN